MPEPRERSFGRGERERLDQSPPSTPELASENHGAKDSTWLWEDLGDPHYFPEDLRLLAQSDLTYWLTYWEVFSPLWSYLIFPSVKWQLDQLIPLVQALQPNKSTNTEAVQRVR